MSTTVARVLTPNAARYVSQLCKHWGHKFAVRLEEGKGHIDFGDGRGCTLEASAGHLDVAVEAPEAELSRMREVVAVHLNRFAHREGELVFEWRSAAA